MKKDIHPKYYTDAKIVCACGNEMLTGSTEKEIRVELCSSCHPFYTGKSVLIDTEGRVEKFKNKQAAKQGERQSKRDKADKRAKARADKKAAKEPELLVEA